MISPPLAKPMVTVICATYNHESYIRDALQGFVDQKTTFPFEVLIGDDCSTDGTRDIIEEYARQYPDTIKPVLRRKNIGAGRNWVDLIERSSSRYLAFCDGDDYWNDSNKLQLQFDYMEANENLRGCFHDAIISVETTDGVWFQAKDWSHTPDGSLRWPTGNKRFVKKDHYTLEDYIPFGFIHTSSMFLRWDYSIPFPEWYFNKGVGDFPLWALQVGGGSFGYIDKPLSVHRRTSTGSYDFASRKEFWAKTKPGWIALEDAMIRYFTRTVPLPAIVKLLEERQKDDLEKLIKACYDKKDPRKTWADIRPYRKHIKQRLGVAVPYLRSSRKVPIAFKELGYPQTAMPQPKCILLAKRVLRKAKRMTRDTINLLRR